MSKFDPYDHLKIELNPDGTITRLVTFPSVDPTPDSPSSVDRPVLSKDVIINPQLNTSARIFLPIKTSSNVVPSVTSRLPILLYFHGCTWVVCGSNSFLLHRDRETTAWAISSIIILVNYRLAPENRLPAQYDDVVDALLWVKQQAVDPDGDKWLRDNGDFSRCYIAGSGNGANMAFHGGLRALDVELEPVKIAGLIMNQPLFGGNQRTRTELKYSTDTVLPLPVLDLVWTMALPEGADRDHWYCNPMVDGPHKEKLRRLPRCLVTGFGMDPSVDRQEEFVKLLLMNGVQVVAQFDEIGFHRIELVDPRRQATILNIYKQFVHHR